MASLRVNIKLNNIDGNLSAGQLADAIENMIRRHTGLEPRTTVFDNDGASSNSPISTFNTFNKVRR